VYWTRRLVVVVVAFALVFGIARLLGSGGSGTGPSARPVGAEASSITTAPASSASSADVTPSETVTAPTLSSTPTGPSGATGKKSASATPLAEPSGTCDSSDVVATPAIKDKAYAAKPVVFAISLTTKVSPACDFTVSSRSLAMKITSGSDRVWSTQECTGAVPKQSVVVRKDTPVMVDVAWNGQRSDSDCTRTTTWAEPGYYHAVVAAFGADPVDEQFELKLAPRPTVTATPTPDAKASAKAKARAKASADVRASTRASASAKASQKPAKRH